MSIWFRLMLHFYFIHTILTCKKQHLKNGNCSFFEQRVEKDGEVLSLVFVLRFTKTYKYRPGIKSQTLGFRAPTFYRWATKTLGSYMTPVLQVLPGLAFFESVMWINRIKKLINFELGEEIKVFFVYVSKCEERNTKLRTAPCKP